MSDTYASDGRRGSIFFAVLALHSAVLYCLSLHKLRQEHSPARDKEVRIDLSWPKPPRVHDTAKPPAPQPAPVKMLPLPKSSPAPSTTPQEPEPAPPQSAPGDKKPLDLDQILKDVGPMVRKLDSEQPRGHAAQAEPGQPGFEARLARILDHATPPPKFYEPARVEMYSSGTQLDLGIVMYKIVTFAGSYCVTYRDGVQTYVGSCPIMQF